MIPRYDDSSKDRAHSTSKPAQYLVIFLNLYPKIVTFFTQTILIILTIQSKINGLLLNPWIMMKLAEALLLRSDLKTKLASLQQRINNNVLIQEGDQPSEDPQHLINEAIQINQELHQLIEKIHATNAQAKTISGHTMLSALTARDLLKEQHRILQQAMDNARREPGRYSSSEIRWIKTVSIAELQQQTDEISQQLRKNNLEIQASNWQIDLL